MIRLKKGFDIKLNGTAKNEITEHSHTGIYAIKPSDFPAISPKLSVKVGEEVQVGDALLHDKQRPEIKFPSPVSGEIVEILLGPKRVILEIRVLADKEQKVLKHVIEKNWTKESVTETLLKANLWGLIKQRPYSGIANPTDSPKAIHISTFDTAPLAPDLDFVISQNKESFETGLKALNALAGGKLSLGVKEGSSISFGGQGEVHQFSGPHPAGNVGIQIHHINQLKPGEIVWYVEPQDVIVIGKLMITGSFDPERVIAITGSEAKAPKYYKVKIGQSLKSIWEEQSSSVNNRLIQGNVLTGAKSHLDDFLSFYCSQLTVIPEGAHSEFLGWLLPSSTKLSLSRTFFSWLMPNKTYDIDTNLHGEERAFVVSGQYEKVLPMNLMPVQLIKAIMAKDIERMEALGIYELAEEDLALCEFVCTSKIEVQKILRQGLDLLKSES